MKNLIVILLFLTVTLSSGQTQEKENTEIMKPALIVIDIQNDFLQYSEEREKTFALEYINGCIYNFRQHGFPIVRVYHTDPVHNTPAVDSEGFQFPESILIESTDPMVIKNYGNAFKKTELDKILKEKGCNTLFLVGLSATGCVIATYFGAIEFEYDVFLVKDALMSGNPDHTNAIEDIFNTITYTGMDTILKYVEK